MRIRLMRHPHVKRSSHAEESVAFALELRGMLGGPSTPDIEPGAVRGLSFNACHAERNTALAVAASEATAIAPRGIEVTIVRPGGRPVVTTGREPLVGGEIK